MIFFSFSLADDEFAFAGDNASIADEGEDPDDSLSQMETARRKQRFERDSYLREERVRIIVLSTVITKLNITSSR